MALNTAVPVRLDVATAARLRAVSERSGFAVAHLIRMAVEDYLAKVEEAGEISVDLGKYPKPKHPLVELNERQRAKRGKSQAG